MLKALSLWNPWAILVPLGEKRIETRKWPTSHRGELLIHAARQMDATEAIREPFVEALKRHGQRPNALAGQLIARVTLRDCVPIVSQGFTEMRPAGGPWVALGPEGLIWGNMEPPAMGITEHAFGNYAPGRWAWIMDDVRPLDPPLPARGRQRIWNVPVELERQVRTGAPLAHA